MKIQLGDPGDDQRNIVGSPASQTHVDQRVRGFVRRARRKLDEDFLVVYQTRQPVAGEQKQVARQCVSSRAVDIEVFRYTDRAGDDVGVDVPLRLIRGEHSGV